MSRKSGFRLSDQDMRRQIGSTSIGRASGQVRILRSQGTSGEYESMKSREQLIRLKKFQVDEKRRKVAQIEGMIAEFDRMAADLRSEEHTSELQSRVDISYAV